MYIIRTLYLILCIFFYVTGVWFMHCHLERHVSWGMEMAFIVKDGKGSQEKLLPPPPDMPQC